MRCEGQVLLVAPAAQEAEFIVAALTEIQVQVELCDGLADCCRVLESEGAGVLFLAQEALRAPEVATLVAFLNQQPEWSELPVLVLTVRGELEGAGHQAQETFAGAIGAVALLERPLRRDTLLSAVRVALRSRRRQYQMRDLLAALRESEGRFAAFMSHLPAAAWIKDLQGRYLYANAEAERIFSRTFPELKGRTDEQLFPAETARQFRENDRQVLARNGAVQTTEVLRQADGFDHHSVVSKFAVPDAGGKPAWIGGVAFDITERRRAEEALRERDSILSKILSTPTVGILFFTLSGRITDANAALLQMTGYSREEFLSLTDWRLLTAPDFQEHTERCVQQLATTGNLHPYEKQWLRKDGSRFWGLFAITRLSGTGMESQCVAFIVDISDRKRLQSELEQHAAGLDELVRERTAKLEEAVAELEHFSYTITHDMRAPLRAINGFAGILNSFYPESLSEEGRDLLRRISESCLRMDQLITDALQYSRVVRDQLDLQPLNPGTAIRGIIESYPQFQSPHARITVQPEMPRVMANQAALTQVFSNLLGNAVKFVTPGRVPEIAVTAEVIPSAGESRSSVKWVRLCVADNGIGIPAEFHQKVWQMFHRLSKKYEGTGIGLALVQKVVERMGGRVGVSSSPGQGSRFWVELKSAP